MLLPNKVTLGHANYMDHKAVYIKQVLSIATVSLKSIKRVFEPLRSCQMAQNSKFYVYSTQFDCESHCYTLELNQSSKYEVKIIVHDIQDDQDEDDDDEDEEGEDGEGIEAKERRRSILDTEDDDEPESSSSNDSASSMASDDKTFTQTSSAIPLDNEGKCVAHRDNPMHVTAITPNGGHIQGTLRPRFWEVRLHGSDRDFRVHAARFAESLGPNSAMTWVRDASNNILGHIISVGFFKGSEIALIMPAKEVFEICNKLNPPAEVGQGIVGGLDYMAKVAVVEFKGQANKKCPQAIWFNYFGTNDSFYTKQKLLITPHFAY